MQLISMFAAEHSETYLALGVSHFRETVTQSRGSLGYTSATTPNKTYKQRSPMKGEKLEQWRQLCELAAIEQDPERLLALVKEINRLLDEKEKRLREKSDQSEQ
jgi:hypothetical protein